MQTFLPFADFAASAAVLDDARLGKQRVETLQILRALHLPDYGWRNHPAVRMWRGREAALVVYGLVCVAEWRHRGYADSTAAQIAEFAPDLADADQSELARRGLLPSWVGDEAVHASHRSRLVEKDSAVYRPLFPDAPPELDYVWPEPDGESPSLVPGDTDALWVLRPESPAALGAFLVHGVAGFGAAGAELDATGLDAAALKDALGLSPGRRLTRPLTALLALVHDVRPGDPVAVEVEQGGRLLTGEVVGEYRYRAPSARHVHGWEHARAVRWEQVVPRSAVAVPAALQDVRPLFRVALRDPLEPAGGTVS